MPYFNRDSKQGRNVILLAIFIMGLVILVVLVVDVGNGATYVGAIVANSILIHGRGDRDGRTTPDTVGALYVIDATVLPLTPYIDIHID